MPLTGYAVGIVTSHVAVPSSVLAADAPAGRLMPLYPLGAPIRCRSVPCGVNDTYRVDTDDDTSCLRVSPHGESSEAKITAELALIDGLDRRGIRVVRSVPGANGAPSTRRAAAEGELLAILFAAVEGEPPGPSSAGSLAPTAGLPPAFFVARQVWPTGLDCSERSGRPPWSLTPVVVPDHVREPPPPGRRAPHPRLAAASGRPPDERCLTAEPPTSAPR